MKTMKIMNNNNNNKFNPYYIAGLIQADGNFSISICKKGKNIWLSPKFNLTLHKKNENIIKGIKDYFGVGYYYIDNKNICRYNVNKITDLIKIIIPFFIKYKLRGEKYISFIMFKIVVTKLYNKEHYIKNINPNNLTKHSTILLNLINMSYNINPLSKNRDIESKVNLLRYLNEYEREIIKSDLIYKDILNEELIKYPNNQNINIEFIKGIFDGDGNITAYLNYNKIGNLRIRLYFNITQDIHNKKVLEEIQEFFNCGNIYDIKCNAYRYDVKSINDIKNKVLPLFKNINKDNNNTIKLNKLWYAKEIINWIDNNKLATIDNENKLIEVLNLMYYIFNNTNNINIEEYIKNNKKKYIIKKYEDIV